MEITYHNGKIEEENIYLTEDNNINLGTKEITINEMPKMVMSDNDLRILFYGNKIFMWLYNSYMDLSYLFVLEQNNNLKVIDYWFTTFINENHPLLPLVTKKYSIEYERQAINIFINSLRYVDYLINPDKLRNELETELFAPNSQMFNNNVANATIDATKSLADIARQTGLNPRLLWDRTHKQGLSIEEAVALGKPRKKKKAGVQPKLYNGKSLKEIAEENGVEYKTLWTRLKKGESIEVAVAKIKERKGRKGVSINE